MLGYSFQVQCRGGGAAPAWQHNPARAGFPAPLRTGRTKGGNPVLLSKMDSNVAGGVSYEKSSELNNLGGQCAVFFARDLRSLSTGGVACFCSRFRTRITWTAYHFPRPAREC